VRPNGTVAAATHAPSLAQFQTLSSMERKHTRGFTLLPKPVEFEGPTIVGSMLVLDFGQHRPVVSCEIRARARALVSTISQNA